MSSNSHVVEILGLIAGTLTTISFVPQVLQIWRTKQVRDVSLPMFIIFSVGTLAWLIYGLLIHSIPVATANSVTLVLGLTVLGMKWKYGRR